jgi:hypothetical protein
MENLDGNKIPDGFHEVDVEPPTDEEFAEEVAEQYQALSETEREELLGHIKDMLNDPELPDETLGRVGAVLTEAERQKELKRVLNDPDNPLPPSDRNDNSRNALSF